MSAKVQWRVTKYLIIQDKWLIWQIVAELDKEKSETLESKHNL